MDTRGEGFDTQKALTVVAVSAELVAAEAQHREQESKAAIAAAADYVRMSGATDADGTGIDANGDYAKTPHACNGHAVYEKVGSESEIGMWWHGGVWMVGAMDDVGTVALDTCRVATAVPCMSVSPELAKGGWKVYVDEEWEDQTSVKVVAISAAVLDGLQTAAAAIVRVSGAVCEDSSPFALVNGDYAKSDATHNMHVMYVKKGAADTCMMWYDLRLSKGPRWVIGPQTAMRSAEAADEDEEDGEESESGEGEGESEESEGESEGSDGTEGVEGGEEQKQDARSDEDSDAEADINSGQKEVHENIGCDGCKMDQIFGPCWRCTECDDYDLCDACHSAVRRGDASVHDITHVFRRRRTRKEDADKGFAFIECGADFSFSPVKQAGVWKVVGVNRVQKDLKVEVIAQTQPHRTPASAPAAPVTTQKEAPEPKFSATQLSMGNASESDLNEALGLNDPAVLSQCIAEPLKTMEREWLASGSDTDWANFKYVCRGRARQGEHIPLHVRETFRAGQYHGGSITEDEYDTGHDGMDLAAFCELEAAKLAGLRPHHVAAIRLYTSDSFMLFNSAMRQRVCPHPIKTTMYFLSDALKKLRKVDAKTHPDAYNELVYLWRGMKNMSIDLANFKKHGGTELAPMSTTASKAHIHSQKSSLYWRSILHVPGH